MQFIVHHILTLLKSCISLFECLFIPMQSSQKSILILIVFILLLLLSSYSLLSGFDGSSNAFQLKLVCIDSTYPLLAHQSGCLTIVYFLDVRVMSLHWIFFVSVETLITKAFQKVILIDWLFLFKVLNEVEIKSDHLIRFICRLLRKVFTLQVL